MSPKIVKFQGNYYFECQWTGVKLTSRYGIPKKNNNEREGAFADAACAVSYLFKQREEDDISEKTLKEKLASIHDDLRLHKTNALLEKAPQFDDAAKVDFSYRERMPQMYQPHLHVQIATDLEGVSTERKTKSKKLCFVIVPVEGEVTQQSLDKGSCLDLEVPFPFLKLASGSQKSKDLVVFSSEEGEVNPRLNSLFPPKEGETPVVFHGTGLVICKVGDERIDLFATSPDKKRKSSKKSKEETLLAIESFVNVNKKQKL